MATVQKANKFFATHEKASHQGPECIHFAAFVPRSLSLSDAQELVDVLTELLPKQQVTTPVADVEDKLNLAIEKVMAKDGLNWKKAAAKVNQIGIEKALAE